MLGVTIGAFVAEHLRLFDAYSAARRAMSGSEIIVLLYHNVAPKGAPWLQAAIKPEDFERQVAYLCRVARVIPLE